MKRLLPYRNTNEKDIINCYALDDTYINNSTTGTGFGDDGVFVTVSAGNLDLDPIAFSTDSYLGKTDYPFVGFNQRPSVTAKVRPAASGDIKALGVTLKETALYDENGEYLSRHATKRHENDVCLKGTAVPIVTRGELMVSYRAVDGTLTVGNGFKLSATSGKITGCTNSDSAYLGPVLASGSRGLGGTLADTYSGVYYKILLK